MTHRITPLIVVCILFPFFSLKAQSKVIGECSIQFVITQVASLDTIGTKWVYVKGDACKTVLTTPQLIQTLWANTQQTTATITKEIGSSHFLQEIIYPPINSPNLLSMKELVADSVVKILGYTCKGVELKWSDGITYQIWYTPEIATTVNAFELAFKEVSGLVLLYTIIPSSGNSIQYQATKIDFSPIPLSQYNINRDQYQRID
jgi:hypothetical protein